MRRSWQACINWYQGGNGLLSPNPRVSAWSGWAVAYFKSCDGGAFTGSRVAPAVTTVANASGSIYYRGHYSFLALLDKVKVLLLLLLLLLATATTLHTIATIAAIAVIITITTISTPRRLQVTMPGTITNLFSQVLTDKRPTEIMLSGCSSGGLAAYLKCDVAARVAAAANVTLRCMPDSGIFPDFQVGLRTRGWSPLRGVAAGGGVAARGGGGGRRRHGGGGRRRARRTASGRGASCAGDTPRHASPYAPQVMPALSRV